MIPINRTTVLVFGIIGVFLASFGFYYYFAAAKYDLVVVEGTLRTSGEYATGRKGEITGFEFYIKEKPIRFRVGSIAYKYFKGNLFNSFSMLESKISFEVDRNELANPNRPSSDSVQTVWVYSLKDEKYTYLSLEDSQKSDLENRKYGLYLGIGFSICSIVLFWYRTKLHE